VAVNIAEKSHEKGGIFYCARRAAE
jgi:hypothetical protein